MGVSVIIPVRNEAAMLPGLLAQLARQRGVAFTVTVVDGGSSDQTRALATAMGATVVTSPPGRGCQMNAGVQATRSDILLFLHADSRLAHVHHLADAVDFYRQSLSCHGTGWAGHFCLHFRRRQPGHERFFRVLEAKSRLNRGDCVHGDQGMMITRAWFQTLGGFETRWPFLEDRAMAEQVAGRWLLLPGVLETSARRFEEEGVVERQILNALLLTMRHLALWSFLEQAPGLYATQTAGPLRLAPFCELAHRLFWQGHGRQILARCCHLGSWVMQAAWQVFFWLDVLWFQAPGWGSPCLAFYRRWLEPWWTWRLWHVPAAGLGLALFYGVWIWTRLGQRERNFS